MCLYFLTNYMDIFLYFVSNDFEVRVMCAFVSSMKKKLLPTMSSIGISRLVFEVCIPHAGIELKTM